MAAPSAQSSAPALTACTPGAGTSWRLVRTVDSGASGYSSLQPCGDLLCLLYEQSDSPQLVMNPDRFVFLVL